MHLCGKTEVDHFIPLAKGGRDIEANMQLVHADCNRAKADAWPA